MRNKIPCSAERLSLLDPPMIQGVVDRNAFHLGSQYLSENRVRIVEANEAQISSAVAPSANSRVSASTGAGRNRWRSLRVFGFALR